MDRFEMFENLRKFVKNTGISPTCFYVGAGGALLARRLRATTKDIDMAVGEASIMDKAGNPYFNKTLNCWFLELPKLKIDMHFRESQNANQFRKSAPRFSEVEGFLFETLESVLDLKTQLNREKDQDDISILRLVLGLPEEEDKEEVVSVDNDKPEKAVAVSS